MVHRDGKIQDLVKSIYLFQAIIGTFGHNDSTFEVPRVNVSEGDTS